MEDNRLIKSKFVILMGILFIFPFFTYAYSAKTTHPALTSEIVTFFNTHYPELNINDREKEFIITGSTEEDEPVLRVLKHFYDPVYKRGLAKGFVENMSSKEWSQNTRAQSGFVDSKIAGLLSGLFSDDDDYSWERAIYEYTWDDSEYGLLALGHVLHLIEDAAVPDHTRNDAHLTLGERIADDKSPYEKWVAKFDVESINVAEKIKGKQPIILPRLDFYFDSMATYSNNNFFSKDTILTKDYSEPVYFYTDIERLSNGKLYEFGYRSIGGIKYRLIFLGQKTLGINNKILSINKDVDGLVLSDYWNLLSQQAVLHGAGVVKLFFDEVEKERETKELYTKNRSWIGKLVDKTKERIFNIAGTLYGTSLTLDDVRELNDIAPNEPPPQPVIQETPDNALKAALLLADPAEELVPEVIEEVIEEVVAVDVEENILQEGDSAPFDENQNVNLPPEPFSIKNRLNSYQPGFGGGGNSSLIVDDSGDDKDTTSPDAPSVLLPAAGAILNTTQVTFSGTSEERATVQLTYEYNNVETIVITTADTEGVWATFATVGQGTTTVNFIAIDLAGNKSAVTAQSLYVDSLGPDISLTAISCGSSFSTEGCLVATTTLTFSWSSSDSDLSYFIINANGPLSTTTATSTSVTAEDNSIFIFEVGAYDVYGNGATSTQRVEVATLPVVINEIAWAGTAASFADEWIELYNPTSYEIDLSGWVLYAKDLVPYINLEDSISAGGYYLIERRDDDTVSDIAADLVVPFSGVGEGSGLKNKGEHLFLVKTNGAATTTIDEVKNCFKWCGGLRSSRTTMERFSYRSVGTDELNWGSSLGEFIQNGLDAEEDAIKGTPKAKNSISYKIVNGPLVYTDTTLTQENSPYIITRGGLIIQAGSTLTALSGVVIKLVTPNEPSIIVNGTFITQGTKDSPVVITSFKDDVYGGDFNGDGVCDPGNASSTASCPAPGNWKQIVFGGLILGPPDLSIYEEKIGRSITTTQ